MDPSAPTPDRLAHDDLDDVDDLQDGDTDDNYGDDPQEDAPVAEPDPIEAAITRGASSAEVLRLVRVKLARLAAYLGWSQANPGVFSLSKAVDLARAAGRQQRALATLAQHILAEMRDGPDPDPPQELVDRCLALLHQEVVTVIREVAPTHAGLFEQRLAQKMAEDRASPSA